MSTKEFRVTGELLIQWRTPREGPHSFLTWWPNVSRIFLTEEALLAALPQQPPELLDWLKILSQNVVSAATDSHEQDQLS